ncbi:glycosyltransferase family 2 protein [Streptomyces caniscabiei]|uniref:glycosyltransferase family 2 protein n=1 Tax=Streptomyces caniscabiei TaxID=2746961 RepID=UPI0029BC6C72|nr:glycosyltransferase family 2 protein [Streptomyces caniscabiei]MDX2775991.1 glycosyltransferase family 2 protein [Streptomyces caniscabiei]
MIYLGVFTIVMTILMAAMVVRLQRALDTYKIKKNYTAALQAPSVSVCIPARNETHAMTQCLERVLTSDYKKLEVIVFDDSSTDDTSVLVRSFAHAGVRFVPGVALPEGWLGRNHALEVLAREASGTYVLFMDVDTNIQPTTVSQLVGHMMTEKLVMTSVLPGRSDTWRASTLFGHLRYFWELILSRRNAPAASSALWMIDRHVLLDTLGGFTPHKNEVLPEEHIAAIVGPVGYHCLISNHTLGVTYEKKWRSQVETSRRLLFPMMGGMWYGALAGVFVLLLLNMPLGVLIAGLVGYALPLQVAGIWFTAFGMVVYGLYLRKIWPDRWWLGGLLWPYVILQELCLFVLSVWGYMRGSITWKGRSVTASPIRVDHLEINL